MADHLRAALPDFPRAAPAEPSRLDRHRLADIVAARPPPRANRSNPRIIQQKLRTFRV